MSKISTLPKREYMQKYYLENKEKLLESARKWRSSNLKRLKEYQVEYYKENCEKIKTTSRQYVRENKKRIRIRDNKKYHENLNGHRDRVLSYNKKLPSRFRSYINAAKTRNLVFELSFEAFSKLSSEPCFYCDGEGSNGIDRINNTLGYIYDNVVPCCTFCNRAKGAYDVEEYIQQCIKVAKKYGT